MMISSQMLFSGPRMQQGRAITSTEMLDYWLQSENDNYVHITRPEVKKTIRNCDVSFANSELHQVYGHVTVTMSVWPKYGHRSLVRCRLPRLCSYSWPLYVCRLINWVVLFFDGFLCLKSWHRTSRWHDFLLSHDLLWLTCWFLSLLLIVCEQVSSSDVAPPDDQSGTNAF